MNTDLSLPPMDNTDFDALDEILDDLRTRGEDVPQWEFCEGAIAALLCTRRLVLPEESFPLVLGIVDGPPGEPSADGEDAWFKDAAQQERFLELWTRRWNEVAQALGAEVETLEDERSYHPEVMDVRGAVGTLSPEEQAELADQELPAFAQVWALGFMFVVENWSDDWATPRDKEVATMIDDALDAIIELTEDDTAKPTVCMHAEDGPPSVSEDRLNAFGAAIWAVYDLRQIWQSLGPRVEPVRKTETPGRNDPCWCGSGKKFKKCHGA